MKYDYWSAPVYNPSIIRNNRLHSCNSQILCIFGWDHPAPRRRVTTRVKEDVPNLDFAPCILQDREWALIEVLLLQLAIRGLKRCVVRRCSRAWEVAPNSPFIHAPSQLFLATSEPLSVSSSSDQGRLTIMLFNITTTSFDRGFCQRVFGYKRWGCCPPEMYWLRRSSVNWAAFLGRVTTRRKDWIEVGYPARKPF